MIRINTNKNGFTLIEILVVIAIIGVLATILIISLGGVTQKARDTKRKSDLNQIGRFLSFGCFIPESGAGEYDINDLIGEIKIKYPQYTNSIPTGFKDPKTGTDIVSNYKYLLDSSNNCALYANLENANEAITIKNITAPTPKGGNGVFAAPQAGRNGSTKYFQVTN